MPGFDHPQVTLIPQYVLLRVRGDSSMQSADGSGDIINNSAIALSDMGLGDREEDVGGTIHFGDGFSGADLSYLRIDHETSTGQTLPTAYGAVRQGDVARPRFEMDEYRLRYAAAVFDHETDSGVRIQLGPGVLLAHRNGELSLSEVGRERRQAAKFRDNGIVYLGARSRFGYRGFALQADYAINPDVTWGGDFDGVLHDLEVTGSFTFEDQALRLYAGYRRSDLDTSGTAGPFAYSSDVVLDGYVLGVGFTF